MRRSISLLLVPAILAGFSPGLCAQTAVRYDGIYQQQAERGSDGLPGWTYLRFTPDGMVIVFPTNGRPDQLGSFSLSNTMLPFASVSAQNGRISFTVSDCDGALVDYEGRAEDDRLYFRVHANNGYQADRVFEFVPVPADRLRQWDNASGYTHQPCGPFGTRGR